MALGFPEGGKPPGLEKVPPVPVKVGCPAGMRKGAAHCSVMQRAACDVPRCRALALLYLCIMQPEVSPPMEPVMMTILCPSWHVGL